MLRANNGIPLYRQLYNRLRDRIDKGKFKPGQKLPSERSLAAHHGISRLTVRKALGMLQEQGYIHAQHGRGYFVAPSLQDNRHQLMPSLGSHIEGHIEGGAPQGPSGRLIHREVIAADAAMAARLQIQPDAPVIHMRWLRYKNECPFALSDSYIPYRLAPRILEADLSQRSYYEFLEQETGIHVWRSQQEIQAVLADKAELELLELSAPAPLLLSHQITFDEHNRPIEYARVLFTGDESPLNLDTRHRRR
jgi:GntR family transcriptional regulator